MPAPLPRPATPATAITRRDVMRAGGAAVALSALRPVAARAQQGPVGTGGASGRGLSFDHGVASGDPLSDRVVLWTRVTGAEGDVPVRWRVYADEAGTRVVDHGQVDATSDRDWTVKVDPVGLQPATTYWFDFRVPGGVTSPLGRTRTLPVGAADRARIGLVSCSNYSSGHFNAYRALAAEDVDAWLHVGDWLYEGGAAGSLGRAHLPPREITTLADYRIRHAQYRTDPDLQLLSASHPLIAVWDDHESTNNSWRDGAANHQSGEGDWPTRKAWSARAYDEWMPIRLPDPADPLRIWRRFAWGDLIDLFMLDTRLQRNAPETDEGLFGTESRDASRTMLGADQKAWLLDGLGGSTARWRVLGQQVKLAPHRNMPTTVPLPYLPPEVADSLGIRQGGGQEGADNWGAYAHERDEIMGFLRDGGIANTVVLAGDIHTAWASDVVEDPLTPFNPISAGVTGVPGYDPLLGRGSVAVEFTCPSVTSNNLAEVDGAREAALALNAAVVAGNPNVVHQDNATHGFVLLDVDRDRVRGEFWDVGDVRRPFGPEDDAVLTSAWISRHGQAGAPGTDHLVPDLPLP